MSIERVVTLLSPLFTAASGGIVAWVGSNFPGGPQLSSGEIAGLFAVGATAGIAAALKWLHGRQKFVQLEGDVDRVVAKVVDGVKDNTQLDAAVKDFKVVLEGHEAQIVDALGKLAHASPSMEAIVQEILQRLSGTTVPMTLTVPAPVEAPPAA